MVMSMGLTVKKFNEVADSHRLRLPKVCLKSVWSIVYLEGSQVIISKHVLYFFL